MPLDNEIVAAWRLAASDLGIRVEAPFSLRSDEGEPEWVEAHIADFGGSKGIVVTTLDRKLSDTSKRLGYNISRLSPQYRTYARQFFIDTLDDWSWRGEPGKEPSWYTGKPWC